MSCTTALKNTLATVQAIMGTTMRFSTTMEEFQQAFVGRVAALSKTHSLLTEDKDQLVSFKVLLQNELEPFHDRDRVALDGRDVMLPAHLAVPVGMAIHELTTNAVKYGALSIIGGKLIVSWYESAGNLIISWREENVPNVVAPEHVGFGSQLLTRVLPQQIGADVKCEYGPNGLNASLSVPITQAPPH